MRKTKEEAEKTRNSILDATLILFDKKGYDSTTLSDIANDAALHAVRFIGISPINQLFFLH